MPAKARTLVLPGTTVGLDTLRAEEPRFVRKMDCISVDRVDQIPAGPNWLREVKWDGYRVCIIKRGNTASIRTKANLPPSARYRHIEDALARSPLPDCVLDGELIALDGQGRPSFQLLQQSRRNRAEIVVYAFDLLNYAGRDLKGLPLSERRAALEGLASAFPPPVRVSELLPAEADMARLIRALDEQRLEGIVVKLASSAYTEGKTSRSWMKHRLYKIDEFSIGGYLKRDDPYFDALIVGQKDANGRLLYKEKVRFGFDDETKRNLLARMQSFVTKSVPFVNLPEPTRRGALTGEQMREAVWITPGLRCTVEYVDKTESGNIRGHGRFGQLLP